MKFCPDCGTGHECLSEEAAINERVEIVRLETARDVAVAKINASAGVTIAEVDAIGDVANAEGIAEGMSDVLDALSGGGAESADPGAPIVVDADPDPDPEPEPEPDMEPPVVDVPTSPPSKSGGYWDKYS